MFRTFAVTLIALASIPAFANPSSADTTTWGVISYDPATGTTIYGNSLGAQNIDDNRTIIGGLGSGSTSWGTPTGGDHTTVGSGVGSSLTSWGNSTGSQLTAVPEPGTLS
jgi:hypothetical protein